MEATQTFEFKGQQVEFDMSKETIMVNATEMAKVFDKRLDVFLKTEHSKAFMDVIKSPPYGGNLGIFKESDLILKKGRSGTWMHRILALKFAAWLDPEFEVWVYMTIDKLMFGDVRSLIAEKARVDRDIRRKKQAMRENEEYNELILLEQKANSLKTRISGFSKSQYQLFVENEDLN
ncbi:MAG: KilA-N domain-containing protein [Cytophagales bacterium]|nr:KilA-N domain-containing protein [Cytophagales bacterium]